MRHLRGWGRWLRRRVGGDSGQVTAFAVVFCAALLAIAGLVLDGGLALSAKVQALDSAEAAARAGAQELDLPLFRTTGVARLDPTSAAETAEAWLASAGLDGEVSATISVVTVTVHSVTDTQLLQLVGVDELRVSATASAAAVQTDTGSL